MTFTPQTLLNYITHFEAGNFKSTSPFYYESSTKTINFGYGINLTAVENAALAGNTTIKSNLIAWLETQDIPVDIANDTIAGIAWSQFSSANLVMNGNGSALAASLNQALPSGDYTTAAESVTSSYVNAIVIPDVTAQVPNLNSLPITTQWALEDAYYHSPALLGIPASLSITFSDARNDNLVGVAEQLAFNAIAASKVNPNQSGLEERLLGDAMLALGVVPTFNGSNQIVNVNPLGTEPSGQVTNIANFLSAVLNPNNSLGSGGQLAQSYVDAWGSGPAASYNTIVSQLESYLETQGYYVTQPGDTAATIASAITAGGVFIAPGAQTLTDINAVFGIDLSNPTPGTVVHVPATNAGLGFVPDANTATNLTQVLDPSADATYNVGGALDGSTAGALIVDVAPAGGNYPTFGAGTYGSISDQPDGSISVGLVAPAIGGSVPLGTLDFNLSTGAESFTALDGTVIPLTVNTPIDISDPEATPESVLLSYLGQLGDSTSASALDTLNDEYLNPTGTAYNVTGNVQATNNDTAADVTYDVNGTPGAVVAGQDTAQITYFDPTLDENLQATVPATNILDASGDISQDSISNIQQLVVEGGVTLTEAQFDQFPEITGSGTITAATGGTFDLTGSNVDQSAAFNLTATDWSGTTLIGNDQDNQTLTASLFGNDTLEAGDGMGDTLVAGDGVDTLIGGTGGDTFVVNDGLAAGSNVQGNGSNNVLQAADDISGATVTGVQTLGFMGDLTVNAAELAGFANITGSGTIMAGTGGTYSMAGENVASGIDMVVGTDDGTTLIGSGTGGQTLTASATGTDTLQAGSGAGDTLVAGGGVDTLIGGTGGDTFVVNDGLAAGSIVQGSGSNNILQAAGDISGAMISGVQTLMIGSYASNSYDVTLTASQFTEFQSVEGIAPGAAYTINAATGGTYNLGAVSDNEDEGIAIYAASNDSTTLIGDNMQDLLEASASGNDTLEAGNGIDDQMIAQDSSGNDTLQVGSGNNAELDANQSFGNDILTAGGGNNDILEAEYSAGSVALTTTGSGNSNTLDVTYSNGNDTLTSGDGNDDILNAQYSTGIDMLTAGNGSGDELVAGNGNDTLIGGSGGDDFLLIGTGTYTVQGGTGNDAFYLYGSAGAGTSITGGGGSDILYLTSDINISDMSISGVQTLEGQYVTLTADQFDEFGTIGTGGLPFAGLIDASTGGVYNLATESAGAYDMTALSNDGTTLIGDDADGETLTASAFGNDMLQAGSGTGDTLVAGGGVDTLIGRTGGDTFLADDGLAAGSVVQGNGSNNVLLADGNISGASISGMQTLEIDGLVTLTGAEFNSFSSITSNGFGELDITTSGIFSMAGASSADAVDMTALSNGGTTLIGNNADFEVLSASASGNDTLEAGNGNDDELIGGGGNDTLTAETGADDSIYLGSGSTDTINASNDYISMAAGAQATVNGSGNEINLGNYDLGNFLGNYASASVTLNGTDTIVSANFSETLTDATVSSNRSGDITITTPLGGFGCSNLTLNTGGTATFAVGSDTITFAAGALTSESYNSGAGAFAFGVTSAAPRYSESVTWNPTTGKAILNITDSNNNTFQSSLGYINPGDTLEVSGSLNALYDSSGQELNATQVNSDGSQNDITYNTSGSGSWFSETYAYNAAGTLTSIGWDNDDGSSYTSYYDANGTLQANVSVNADTSGYIATNNNQEVTFAAGDAASGVSVDTSGDVNATITPSGGSAETLALTASGVTVSIVGNTLSDTVSGTNLSVDGSGNMTLTAPLGGFGSSGIVLGVNGTDTFSVGSDAISLAASSLTSLSYSSGSGAFTFDLNSVAPGYSESILWNPTTGKAILDIGSFATSLGYINPGDTLNVTGSTLTLKNSSGQSLDGIQVNSDGSQNDISYNTSGSGSWTDNIYSYDAAGDLTSIRWDNNNGSFVDDFYNPAGDQTGYVLSNADGILHVDTADASSINTSGMTTLDVIGYASITAAQLNGSTSLTNDTGSTDTIYAMGAGSYSLATQSISGAFDLDASQTSADVTLTGDNQDSEVLNGGAGTDTLIAGTGDTTLNGGSGVTTYEFGSSFGQDTVNNNGGSSASGTITFTAANDEDLWFQQSGNNLVVDLLGTNNAITVDNWFGSSAGAQVQGFTAGGLTLDTQMAQLVQAMATYTANNPGFNPATASQMPTDANLQTAIAASWHH
jgi:hypothetical protein